MFLRRCVAGASGVADGISEIVLLHIIFPYKIYFQRLNLDVIIFHGKKWKKHFWRESWYLVSPTSLYYPLHILSVYLLPSSSSRFIYFSSSFHLLNYC